MMDAKKRPVVKIPLTPIDFVFEGLTIAAIVGIVVYVLISFPALPAKIPVHFDGKGAIDGYGNKVTIFFLFPVLLVFYLLFTFLGTKPHLFNYFVQLTEENAERQYLLATPFVRILKLEITVVLSYLEFASIRSAMEANR